LQGGTLFVQNEGIRGGAVKLDKATGDYIDMGDNFRFDNQSYSIQIWVKLNAHDTSYSSPVSKHWAGFQNGYMFGVNDTSHDPNTINEYTNKAFFCASSRPCIAPSRTIVNNGDWHQIVGVYDRAKQKLLLYVDGNFQFSADSKDNISNAAPFRVGALTDFDGTTVRKTYTGYIDELRLYNRSLSRSEIQQLYRVNRPVSGNANGYANVTVTCTNKTSGKRIKFIGTNSTTSSWNCEKKGLIVKPGDKVDVLLSGTAYL